MEHETHKTQQEQTGGESELPPVSCSFNTLKAL